MVLANFLRLSTVINRLHVRKYYSSSVKTLFLNNFNKYEQLIGKDNDSRNLQKINLLFNEYKSLNQNINDVENELTIKSDKELWNMMNDEKIQLESEKSELIDNILNEIYHYEQSKDADRIPSNSSCLFEISAGVGGKEAMLFAHELSAMYSNYFSFKNWNVCDEQTDVEGDYLRHYKAKIEGINVWDHLKYEAGVHRVQRIPKTETKGRIHTSTITVACIPITTSFHVIELTDKDLRIETKRASGAGGQHVNKTESAIRITHIPTGVSVECQEDRSQLKNREIAMRKLKQILVDHQIRETFERYLKTRKSQVGQANRNEKIRTYNYSQDRITDHRLSACSDQEGTVFNLEEFLRSPERLEIFIDSLRHVDQEREILEIFNKLSEIKS